MSGRNSGSPFVLPALVLLSLITVYPVLTVLYLSLLRKLPLFGITRFVGLENYLFLIADDRFWNAFRNTLYFTVLSVSLELLLGLGLALLLNRSFPFKGTVTAIVLIPWAIPTVVSARMWEWMYNTDLGILNHLLGLKVNWLGSPLWALHAAVFMDVWKTIPDRWGKSVGPVLSDHPAAAQARDPCGPRFPDARCFSRVRCGICIDRRRSG
jgi:multiple sugar transport system permease protein